MRDPDLRSLVRAVRATRRGKKPSHARARYDATWLDQVLDLERRLLDGTWSPSPSVCFLTERPKLREIHAPAYADRVLHQWMVPPIERRYERIFIHDSYANRRGKGTHAAVRRVHGFVRQVQSGQGDGHYLQLDVKNCFNRIRREKLYALLKAKLEKWSAPLSLRRAVHALLRHPLAHAGVIYRCSPADRERVPAHKRLANAPRGCGIAIGNLSSQFFVNVLLNELDQFVKHHLKVKRYVRYVDDFVLVHQSREQLAAWKIEIERFLAEQLQLELKDDVRLRPLRDGIDFLGYIIYPTHVRVRRRVVMHAHEALRTIEHRHVRGRHLRATPAELRRIGSVWGSYAGHFMHADSFRLRQAFHRRYPWLAEAARPRQYHHRFEERTLQVPFDAPPCAGFRARNLTP